MLLSKTKFFVGVDQLWTTYGFPTMGVGDAFQVAEPFSNHPEGILCGVVLYTKLFAWECSL